MNLDYLAKSGQIDAASRAEEMLLRIEALHADGYYEKSPDVCSYNSVMNAYAHESGRGDSNSGDGVVVRGYNNIAKAKAERNGASGHAERIMKRMVEQGLVPNEISYNTYLRCVAKDMMRDKKQSIEYQMEQIEKAESILTKMEDLGLANTISYNTLISILSKSKVRNSARQAEACLQRMMNIYTTTSNEKIQPDTCSFNSAIHAYANISNKIPGAVQRAKRTEELLSQMEEMYNSGKNDNVKPDVVSYSTVVNAYAKAACWGEAECAMRAMEILNRMEELHAAGDKDVKPNKRTYTTVS